MSLTEPLSIDPGSGTVSLPRTQVRENGASYASSDGNLKVSLDHAYGRRNRRVIRVDLSKTSADELNPSVNAKKSMSTYIVLDAPAVGFSTTEMATLINGLIAMVNASSGAMISAWIGGQS